MEQENIDTAMTALEHHGTDLLCQWVFSRICDIAYNKERSWSGVNRTVLKTYGAKLYQFERIMYQLKVDVDKLNALKVVLN